MMRLDPPKKFSSGPEEWPVWSTEFRTRFRTAGMLHLEDGEIQRDTLIYCMGQEAEKIYRTLTFDEEGESDTNFDCLMQCLQIILVLREISYMKGPSSKKGSKKKMKLLKSFTEF